jgi:hypothetical protein
LTLAPGFTLARTTSAEALDCDFALDLSDSKVEGGAGSGELGEVFHDLSMCHFEREAKDGKPSVRYGKPSISGNWNPFPSRERHLRQHRGRYWSDPRRPCNRSDSTCRQQWLHGNVNDRTSEVLASSYHPPKRVKRD